VLALPLAPLAVFGVFVIALAIDERSAQRKVVHTLEVKSHLQTMAAQSAEAEAAVFRFLLSRNAAALEPYLRVGEQWPGQLERLAELVADNPEQVAHLQAIASRKDEKPLVQLVQYARSSMEPPPSELLESSREQIARFRGELEAMQRVDDALLFQRADATRRAQERLVYATIAGAALGLVGSLIAAMAFSRGITRRVERAHANAARLATGSNLLPSEPAADEVGELSLALQEAHGLLKSRESELNERVTELGVVNRELEAFSYSVSHDLRAPLRHITGFVALLERSASPKLDDEERRRLGTISTAATKMGQLIDALLAFSRMGRARLALERVRLDDILRDAQREVARDQNGRRVRWAISPLPEVEGDPALLRQAFINLLGNALKYTRDRPEASIEVGVEGRENGEAVVFVRDNGVGFDMQYVDKLFGVFQRLHRQEEFEGTGIGLANVRRIVHRHGGRTWAQGAVDRGATFYVSLPMPGPSQSR
jgi:signal transduction histidine kinase